MEELAGLQDWEFLAPSDGELEHDSENSTLGSESADDGAIKTDYFSVKAEVSSPSWISTPDAESVKNSSRYEGNPDRIESSSDEGLILDESPNQEFQIQRQDPSETPIAVVAVNPESGSLVEGEDNGGVHVEEIYDDPKVAVPAPQLERDGGIIDLGKLPVTRGERAGLAWWKLPMELLKFLALRVRPAWSISFAAALIGAFMLGRKLYRKKTKSRRIPLKVAVSDKVSPFQVPVSRLNEAFSAVKRVPVIRASLPAAGTTPWPLVALR